MGVYAHGITSVGVGFSPNGENVGSGDLLGNVWVTRKDRIDPLHTCTVSGWGGPYNCRYVAIYNFWISPIITSTIALLSKIVLLFCCSLSLVRSTHCRGTL